MLFAEYTTSCRFWRRNPQPHYPCQPQSSLTPPGPPAIYLHAPKALNPKALRDQTPSDPTAGTRAGLLGFTGFYFGHGTQARFPVRNVFFSLKNPSLAASPPDFKPAEMRNQTRKKVFKSLCIHPPWFHVKDGKFPRDKHPGNQKPCQKALPEHSHVYREPHRGYHRGLGEKEAVIQRALRSRFAFFGALDDFCLAAVH